MSLHVCMQCFINIKENMIKFGHHQAGGYDAVHQTVTWSFLLLLSAKMSVWGFFKVYL